MKKLKPKKKEAELAIMCKHLLTLKPKKIYEIVVEDDSTFMCPKCFREQKMLKDIKEGLMDDWVTVCKNCTLNRFDNVSTLIIE